VFYIVTFEKRELSFGMSDKPIHVGPLSLSEANIRKPGAGRRYGASLLPRLKSWTDPSPESEQLYRVAFRRLGALDVGPGVVDSA
jgi:hypothetical protein